MDNKKLLKIVAEAAGFDSVIGISPFMMRIAELAAAAEREACAKVCEDTTAAWTQPVYNGACMDCAAAIRARGN
jgi:hypothetical protein